MHIDKKDCLLMGQFFYIYIPLLQKWKENFIEFRQLIDLKNRKTI